jgi:hypothetical protein
MFPHSNFNLGVIPIDRDIVHARPTLQARHAPASSTVLVVMNFEY